jgi:hypothetical protein
LALEFVVTPQAAMRIQIGEIARSLLFTALSHGLSVGRSRPQYSNRGAGQDETELTCARRRRFRLSHARTHFFSRPPTGERISYGSRRVPAARDIQRFHYGTWSIESRWPRARSDRKLRRVIGKCAAVFPARDFLTHYHERCADASLPSSRNVTYLSAQHKTISTNANGRACEGIYSLF